MPFFCLGQTQAVMCTHSTHFEGLYGNLQVIDRASRRSKVKNVIQITRNMNELGHIMVIKFKFLQLEQVFDILEVTSDQVIHSDHLVTFPDEPVA